MSVIGFTGTQEGLTILQKRLVVEKLREMKLKGFFTVIHGDCIGADDFFGTAAAQLDYYVLLRPGLDKNGESFKRANSFHDAKYVSQPYLERNRFIVRDADIMLACPKGMEEEVRSGTWATIRYAKKIGRPIEIIYPY